MGKPHIKVEGLRELSKQLRQLGDVDLKAGLRDANKSLAAQVVQRALPNTPVRTGRLAASVRGLGSQQSATVKAGSASVPYAATIEYGRKKRGFIAPTMFLHKAAEPVDRDAADEYLKIIDELIRKAGLD